MMARPTTTSAAATTITNSTATWPSSEPNPHPAATKLRFTALSMSSTDMNMMRALRRTSMPAAPIEKRMAASAM